MTAEEIAQEMIDRFKALSDRYAKLSMCAIQGAIRNADQVHIRKLQEIMDAPGIDKEDLDGF